MDLIVKKFSNVSEFLNLASIGLYEREAEYSLLLGLCELQLKAVNPKNGYQYFYLVKSEAFIGAAVLTEQRLILTELSEVNVQILAQFLHENRISLPGILGPIQTVEAFCKIWNQLTNQKMKLSMGQKIYQLKQVTKPKNVVGKIRIASEIDLNIVSNWLLEFSKESLPNQATTQDKMTSLAKSKIQKQEALLWIDQNNDPVSMNLIGRPTKNGISISGVYTPKNLRGNGYASAVVAATCQMMLDSGKQFCVLYTDISNPTSNKIYQRLGFQEMASSKDFITET